MKKTAILVPVADLADAKLDSYNLEAIKFCHVTGAPLAEYLLVGFKEDIDRWLEIEYCVNEAGYKCEDYYLQI